MVDLNKSDLVSIVVPVFNGADYIHECLLSLINQTHTNIEILVIDDGSTDDTLRVVTEIQSNFPNLDLKVFSQLNKGASSARNTGIRNATGEFIAFLDADDFWDPIKLVEHISRMRSRNLRVLGSLMRYANAKSRSFGICGENPANRMREIQTGRFMPFVLSSIVFEMKLVRTVGFFDEYLRYSQDLEYLARISNEAEVAVIDVPLGFYRLHPSSISTVNGLEQELSYLYIKYKFSQAPQLQVSISYVDYKALHPLSEISAERLAGIHFRNFGVLLINGRGLPAIKNLSMAMRLAPKYVLVRLKLRLFRWLHWRFGGSG